MELDDLFALKKIDLSGDVSVRNFLFVILVTFGFVFVKS